MWMAQGGNPAVTPLPEQGPEAMPLPATPLPARPLTLNGQAPTIEQPVFGPPPGYGSPPRYPQLYGYGQPPRYTSPQWYTPQPAATGSGDASGRGRRNKRPIFAGLGAIAVVAVIAVGALLASAFGANHAGPAATIVYQLVPDGNRQITDATLNTTVEILHKRLDLYGVEGAVEKLPPDRVSLQVFRVGDLAALTAFIGATGRLEFVLLPPETYGTFETVGSHVIPSEGSIVDPSLPAQFNGKQLDPNRVDARADQNNPGRWAIDFAFSSGYDKEFASWTGEHVNDFFAIVLDGKVLSAPYIQAAITDGSGRISGNFTEAGAKDLANVLRAGELPFSLGEVSRTVASPSSK